MGLSSATHGHCLCQALFLLGTGFEPVCLPHPAPLLSWQGAPMDTRAEQSAS